MIEHDWLLITPQLLIRSSAQRESNKICFEVARTQLFQDGALENLHCVCGSSALIAPSY